MLTRSMYPHLQNLEVSNPPFTDTLEISLILDNTANSPVTWNKTFFVWTQDIANLHHAALQKLSLSKCQGDWDLLCHNKTCLHSSFTLWLIADFTNLINQLYKAGETCGQLILTKSLDERRNISPTENTTNKIWIWTSRWTKSTLWFYLISIFYFSNICIFDICLGQTGP